MTRNLFPSNPFKKYHQESTISTAPVAVNILSIKSSESLIEKLLNFVIFMTSSRHICIPPHVKFAKSTQNLTIIQLCFTTLIHQLINIEMPTGKHNFVTFIQCFTGLPYVLQWLCIFVGRPEVSITLVSDDTPTDRWLDVWWHTKWETLPQTAT